MEVRLAATQALFNALEFASSNFSNETERNYLMQARVSPPPLPPLPVTAHYCSAASSSVAGVGCR